MATVVWCHIALIMARADMIFCVAYMSNVNGFDLKNSEEILQRDCISCMKIMLGGVVVRQTINVNTMTLDFRS